MDSSNEDSDSDSLVINDDVEPQPDKAFISKLLGEMKSQFNKSDKTKELSKTEDPLPSESSSTKSSHQETDDETTKPPDNDKPRIVLHLIKTPPKERSPSRRALKKKTDLKIVKRSSRRRSKDCNESILQSAIARKEKSYNEGNKPQRLTRPLKPTKKILENLEMAKQDKNKLKITKPNENESLENDLIGKKKHKHHSNHAGGKGSKRKRLKSSENNKEVETEQNLPVAPAPLVLEEAEVDGSSPRKGQKISNSGRFKEDMDEDPAESTPIVPDQTECPDDPECSSVGAELIASRLCLCTKKTQLYMFKGKDESVQCKAIDEVAGKSIGCSRWIHNEDISLVRPSSRVPYMGLCEMHQNRMLRHNCCPTCGIFCTHGNFVECDNKHQYHKDCQITVGNMECCPHCGSLTPPHEVIVTMHSNTKPVFLPSPITQYKAANVKASFVKTECLIQKDESSTPSECDSAPNSPPLLDSKVLPNLACDVDVTEEGLPQELTEFDLLDVIKVGDLEKLAFILGWKTVDLNFKISDFNDGTVLHYAAHAGLLPVVHMLIVSGIDLDVFDRDQNTPLMLAIGNEMHDVVQYLISAGASIILKGTDGMTALHLAAKCGNLKACKMLLQASTCLPVRNFVNFQDDGGWTPLVWACEHGYVDIANYLILHGADASLRDVEHNVALHWAAYSGSCRITELLLNKDCDVNAVNAHGDSPLHIGAREDRYNCIVVLLARGADVGIVNKNNETPLDCVPEGGQSYSVIALNVHLQGVTCPEDDLRRKTILLNDISKGKESNPIQCINVIDEEPSPNDFTYISKSCITSDNVYIDTKLSSMKSCSCEERCLSDVCDCSIMSSKCWYDDEGKLSNDFNFGDSPLIFECNDGCACNAITCTNRVVQKGLTQRFQINRTEHKGWGVNSLRTIPKGTFVCEYVGEILPNPEADQRQDDTYLFDLDSGNSGADDADLGTYCIDAKFYGNFTRFINHSCSPNLHPVKVYVEHHDLRFPRIAFFASRDIMPDEELSFDYGEKFWIAKYKTITCHCDSPDCKYSADKIQELAHLYNGNSYEELIIAQDED